MSIKTSIPDKLPLTHLKWPVLIPLLGEANRVLGRFEEVLKNTPNPRVVLLPLTRQEARDTYKAQSRATPQEIQRCLKAMGLTRNKKVRALSPAFLKQVHALMTERESGHIRKRQNWIGPTGCRMEEAFCYPPAPRYVSGYLKHLEKYAETADGDPVIQTAIAFAQFLVVHPFMDGNGRVARLLVPLLLYKRGVTSEPLFYMSAYFQKHRKEYFDRLLALSKDHDWEGWISFFLKGVIAQGELLCKKAEKLKFSPRTSKSR